MKGEGVGRDHPQFEPAVNLIAEGFGKEKDGVTFWNNYDTLLAGREITAYYSYSCCWYGSGVCMNQREVADNMMAIFFIMDAKEAERISLANKKK